jgi:hypothetical protein
VIVCTGVLIAPFALSDPVGATNIPGAVLTAHGSLDGSPVLITHAPSQSTDGVTQLTVHPVAVHTPEPFPVVGPGHTFPQPPQFSEDVVVSTHPASAPQYFSDASAPHDGGDVSAASSLPPPLSAAAASPPFEPSFTPPSPGETTLPSSLPSAPAAPSAAPSGATHSLKSHSPTASAPHPSARMPPTPRAKAAHPKAKSRRRMTLAT